jgi:hypothetical protein
LAFVPNSVTADRAEVVSGAGVDLGRVAFAAAEGAGFEREDFAAVGAGEIGGLRPGH